MDNKFVQLEITDQDSLIKACDLLHDARCDSSTVEMDLTKGFWTISFEREFFENPNLMQTKLCFFILTKHFFPLITSKLTFYNVLSYQIEDKSHIGKYMFNKCQIKDDIYELSFCEDMRMLLKFKNKPSGELRDLHLLQKKGSFFTFRNPFKRNDRSL